MFTVASIYWDWRNLWGDVEIGGGTFHPHGCFVFVQLDFHRAGRISVSVWLIFLVPLEIVFPVWDSSLNHTGLYESTRIFKFLFAECDFILDIPLGFLKILDGFPFFVRPPDVFHRIPKVETHVLCDGYALHAGRVGRVVLRVIHFVNLDTLRGGFLGVATGKAWPK